MNTHTQNPNLPSVESEATEWLVMRRDGDLRAQDERAYQAWLDRDPAHRAAAAKVERYWNQLGSLGEDPEILALTEHRARTSNRPIRLLRTAALAASIVAAAGLGWGLRDMGWLQTEPAIVVPTELAYEQTVRTSVGQRTVITLADGSTVTLDTDSILRTLQTSDERALMLERGRAYFVVAKDPTRPFFVTAAGKTVIATGTEFAVDVDSDTRMTVTLVEGNVRVESPGDDIRRPQSVELKPGWKLIAGKEMKAVQVNLERDTGWTSGRLHFMNEPLGRAADAMNRYSNKKIVIQDPEIRERPIIGNFRAGDIDAFVRAVSLYGFATIQLETDDVVELGLSVARQKDQRQQQ